MAPKLVFAQKRVTSGKKRFVPSGIFDAIPGKLKKIGRNKKQAASQIDGFNG